MSIREDVNVCISKLIEDINPYDSVCKCLKKHTFNTGRILVVAIGKAAYTMSLAARDSILNIDKAICISKYHHILKPIEGFSCFEAGHPILDENSVLASKKALEMVKGLTQNDEVILLISGGGSALFEVPEISLEKLRSINDQILKSGASIHEINIIRKRLSKVKGGRFALACAPAKCTSIILSDVLGDDLSAIASGPAVPDYTTCLQAQEIIKKYHIPVDDTIQRLLSIETPKKLNNIETKVIGSVSILCESAKKHFEELGYQTSIICDDVKEEDLEVGNTLAKLAIQHQNTTKSLAFIMGGEAVVKVKGNGLGGRNQEMALYSSRFLKGLFNTCIFGFGSDGTDGPTDAAGGYVDENSAIKLEKLGYDVQKYLDNNDSYPCLKAIDGLIMTGPTGSNVNDIYVLMIKRG